MANVPYPEYPPYQQYPAQYPAAPAQPGISAAPQTLDDQTQKRRKAVKQLRNAIGTAHEVLVTATTVFPFTLFPDTITIDRAKLSVAHRTFFQVAEVISIRIEDILNVTADVGPFFGSVKISTRFFDKQEPPYAIHYLWRHDALKIKRIMQGYVIASQQKIDTSSLGTEELGDMLDELGRSSPDGV
ncbi:MAG TPA: hypothetical protein VF466_04925 [Candidatus Saccharimonadales bacterium]